MAVPDAIIGGEMTDLLEEEAKKWLDIAIEGVHRMEVASDKLEELMKEFGHPNEAAMQAVINFLREGTKLESVKKKHDQNREIGESLP